MVDKSRRKELLQQYAERPPQDGVFAIRNAVTGDTWVGVTRNLDTQKNSLWARFASKTLNNDEAEASWAQHGQAAFSYEILERFTEPDKHAIELLRIERAEHWRRQLNAKAVKGT